MTVRKLKEILEKYPDDYRVVVDYGDPADGATEENEIVDFFSLAKPNPKTVVLQTRNDFDYEDEIEAFLTVCANENVDEDWAINELFERGYGLDDLKGIDGAYEWARQYAEEHGYE